MHKVPETVLAAIKEARALETDPLAAFFYDLDALQQHVSEVMAALPAGVELYYAIKANSEALMLETLAPLVSGFEISSGGEIERVMACPTRKPYVFSGPGKLDSDLRSALLNKVEAIHLESLNEIARLQQLAEQAGRVQPVFLRINPQLPAAQSSRLAMAGTATPFGIDEADLAEAVRRVDNASHLTLKGFHVHAMSHQMSVERHEQLLDFYLQRWQEWKALARDPSQLTHFNVGGGIGVDYLNSQQFDWQRLCRYLEKRLGEQHDAPILRFEPGRFISAYCGYYAIEVLDSKTSHGEHFLVCRGGTHQFRLPVAQSHDHPVIHLPSTPQPAASSEQAYTIVGQLCTPKDVLSRRQLLKGVNIGDLLVLPLAGAYGYNISHADFLCHPRPSQHFVRNGERVRQ
ncbi:type III PLP-dependent enzyme [Pseudomonas syringae]|uniref:type III PLP-dependent enzyme n=1 Tax=Pseudomonas TaxID=286 RepID=UPI000CD2CF35|nr:type III PLP-dependent enzyme [Pseudomonas syringae]MCF5031642.1 type III PLP-dependent enzyme [Pseudomonas syringae]POD23516.1 diaminopimelate decarboxylase [Pseudomonas syringae pv. syringae]RXT88302.1 diaminopimelate decarboxylase [Pseudomonas syringae]UQB22650.1 type III PLP-dependent enzyme [Pseudomonas syringae pv. syringae]